MATRKLKFKPKPVVGGSVRRQREKEEVPELTTQEPTIRQDPSPVNVAPNPDIKSSPASGSDASEVSVSKKTDEAKDLIDCQTDSLGKVSDANNVSSDPQLKKSSTNDTSPQNTTKESSNNLNIKINVGQVTNVDVTKQVTLDEVATLDSENSSKLIDGVCSQDSLFKEPNSETKLLTLTSLPEESSVSLKSTDKKVAVKGLPRFGRSKFKPVLNNKTGPRKKIETNDNQLTDENVTSDVNPVEVIRTESVIKSVQSEIKKSNVVTEITASFSSLESDESEPIVNSSEIKANESSPSTCRFYYSNEDTTTKFTRESNNQHNLVKSANNSTEANKTQHVASSSDQRNTNQFLDQRLNKELPMDQTTSNSQISSPIKVPISPLKSLSKVLVPKPSPNFMETGVRRISFQGSDSEEDSKRNQCLLKQNKSGKRVKREKDVKNNKRKVSQGSTYSKLGQEALAKFTQKFGKVENLKSPDKAKLTMLDLIFYNPKSNPMSVSTEQTGGRRKEEKFEMNAMVKEALEEEKVDDVDEVESTAPAAIPVPQLKVGPDGQIMLDPKSLVIETTEVKEKRAEMEKSDIVRETGITRYNTYSKKKHSRRDWSHQETLQFYKALNTIGSDFSLMAKLFPNRNRHDMKLKFKKEEKTNMKLVDLAMTAPSDFDFSSLEEELRQENEELARVAELKRSAAEAAKKERALKKEEKTLKRKKPQYHKSLKTKFAAFKNFDECEIEKMKESGKKVVKKRKKRVGKESKKLIVSSSSDEDLVINVDSDEDELEESEMKLLEMIRKKTRAGLRKQFTKPKKIEEYEEINETLKRKLEEIDSDISDDGYTPNGMGDGDLLFRSPVVDPFAENPSQDEDGSRWSMEVTSTHGVGDTVLIKNVEGVSELSDLVTLEQGGTALDLSLSLQENVQEVRKHTSSVLNRHLISESIQIIDQLTSSDDLNQNNGNITQDVQKENIVSLNSQTEEEPTENVIPLPSFELVSCSRPPVLYEIEKQYIPDLSDEDSAKICETNNGL